MAYDLVIRGGQIVDGSGGPSYRSDLAIKDGKIAAFGRIRDAAAEVIDADGLAVSPGIVDAHTHLDAQISWDPLGTSSCWHGITSVVMGNCGFSLAPCRDGWKERMMRNLESVEAIPADAMMKGIDWRWGTYSDYLANLERLPKGLNYGGYVGHSAIRPYVMGDRAFTDKATPEDITAMQAEVRRSMEVGALGFSSSRLPGHVTLEGNPMPSLIADWEEVVALVDVLQDMNTGVFEMARDYSPQGFERLRTLATTRSVPVTFACTAGDDDYDRWLRLSDEAARVGGRVIPQANTRTTQTIWSFQSQLPWDHFPVWKDLRKLPMDAQKRALADPAMRKRLIAAARQRPDDKLMIGAMANVKDDSEFEKILVMVTPGHFNPSIAEVARQRGMDPVELVVELSWEKDLMQMFVQPLIMPNEPGLEAILRHPRSVVTFSDSGAHASQICDYSLQTELLSYWVREKQALTLEQAVRKITFEIASAWGLHDRGLLREGLAGDIMIFDPKTIAPTMPVVLRDLPGGAMRLSQRAVGMHCSIVNGQVLIRDGKHSGNLPGKVLRNRHTRERQTH